MKTTIKLLAQQGSCLAGDVIALDSRIAQLYIDRGVAVPVTESPKTKAEKPRTAEQPKEGNRKLAHSEISALYKKRISGRPFSTTCVDKPARK